MPIKNSSVCDLNVFLKGHVVALFKINKTSDADTMTKYAKAAAQVSGQNCDWHMVQHGTHGLVASMKTTGDRNRILHALGSMRRPDGIDLVDVP